ncbi:MAG TPA: BON domain-containing protein [Steroidobacteraceae bacterium]|nr:BON domain-containing protein [Steroidobacteraceae bacterium]
MVRTASCAMLAVLLAALPAVTGAQSTTRNLTLSDRGISNAVENEFFYDSALSLNDINVHTDDGIITLRGRVSSLLAKRRAADLASTVRGARSVINQIDVEPVIDRDPVGLRMSVEEALLDDPATESFEVSVTADPEGRVILRGDVQSWQERSLAEFVAAGVHGVTAVTNLIDVTPRELRPDPEIAQEIRDALRWNANVDDGLIDVAVRGGEVTLSGSVGSLAEKNVAIRIAWTAGVDDVDAAELKVAPWARNEELRADKYSRISDEQIADAVQEALMYDPRVSRFTIEVDSVNGLVTLRGSVADLKAKRAAITDARNTVGVVGVRDRLKVRPGDVMPSDETIAAAVEKALARDPFVTALDIDVSSRGGIVSLHGDVDTWFEKGQADDVAARVKGVVAVDNDLVVEDDAFSAVFDPYVDAWSIYGYEWYEPESREPRQPDSVVAQQIREEFWWSPYVDEEAVRVTVKNGVATLTGDVESWAERRAATENALEGGAVTVVNELTVLSPDLQSRVEED